VESVPRALDALVADDSSHLGGLAAAAGHAIAAMMRARLDIPTAEGN
jgi:hypothetical protein